jgi:hypothetical protein
MIPSRSPKLDPSHHWWWVKPRGLSPMAHPGVWRLAHAPIQVVITNILEIRELSILSLLLSFQPHVLRIELLIGQPKFLANLHQKSEALHIFWVIIINFFIQFQSFLIILGSPVARRHHELPLDFFWLDLRRPLKELTRALVQALFHIIETHPRNGFNINR